MIGVVAALLIAGVEPDPATLVYYNARMQLRERRSEDVLRLWLLRNSLESQERTLSAYDDDFKSLVWVALGDLGYCQDGISFDDDGAGLWPLALHNWFLRNMRRGEAPDQPAPFDAFDIPQQARFVTLQDVLSVDELNSVRFYRTDCYRMKEVLSAGGVKGEPNERKVQVAVLRFLLQAARHTTQRPQVRGQATIEARLLDLRLKKLDLVDREQRSAERERKRRVRDLGGTFVEAPSIAQSEEVAELLSVTDGWVADDWLALEPGRRLYLYDWVLRAKRENPKVTRSMIDRLMTSEDTSEVGAWIAFTGDSDTAKASIWSGERGRRLLALDPKTGFRERAAIALHRGVDAVGKGDLPEALRSLAYTLKYADESTQSEAVRRLGLRWMSFVAGRFSVSDALMTMLVELVPRGDLSQVLEGLIWDAAMSSDLESFDRTVKAHRGRGALALRIERLRPLAEGDVGAFLTRIRSELPESPHATLRFLRRFLERLETQDGDVRAMHRATLEAIDRELAKATEILEGGLGRNARELEQVTSAMLEGLDVIGDSERERARALSPTSEVFAGSIRLAPTDALPWPFVVPTIRPPSVFSPLKITPVEWPDTSGEGLVMGWKLGR
ncbi:MAG: hypothetical protein RIT81_16975 [Deltaproteobacteria bacterium]